MNTSNNAKNVNLVKAKAENEAPSNSTSTQVLASNLTSNSASNSKVNSNSNLSLNSLPMNQLEDALEAQTSANFQSSYTDLKVNVTWCFFYKP
jgi:hypothetical protein